MAVCLESIREKFKKELGELTDEEAELLSKASYHIRSMTYRCDHCKSITVSSLVGEEYDSEFPEGLTRGEKYYSRGWFLRLALCGNCDKSMHEEIDQAYKKYGWKPEDKGG